jgi:hypothetical protein
VQFTNRLIIAAAVCLVVLFVVGVFATRTRTDSNPATKPASAEPKVEVERITVREWGFEPKEIDRPPGPFFLIVQNQSGLEEIDISLVEDSGRPRKKLPDIRNALTAREWLELPPGIYLLKDSKHPEWQCQITIGNKD